jgi:hypothetical protein
LLLSQWRLRRELAALRARGKADGIPATEAQQLLAMARRAHRLALQISHYEEVRGLLSSWRWSTRTPTAATVLPATARNRPFAAVPGLRHEPFPLRDAHGLRACEQCHPPDGAHAVAALRITPQPARACGLPREPAQVRRSGRLQCRKKILAICLRRSILETRFGSS